MHPYIPYETLKQRLSRTQATESPSGGRTPASVALILQQNDSGTELFFIERARHPNDPWSGNIGFPGGRRDPVDATLRHTAERETMEEVGIDLTDACYLGRLSDIVGHNLPVRVSCFVYGLSQPVQPVLSCEVQDAFWFGLGDLASPHRQVTSQVRFDGHLIEAPAIELGLTGKPVLWGITYRLVSQFRQVIESDDEFDIPYELPL